MTLRPLNFDDFAPRKSKLTHLTYIENYLFISVRFVKRKK